MPTATNARRRGASARASARGETTMSDANEQDAGDERSALLTAALIGAAIGAGLGLLASRAIDDEGTVAAFMRTARKSTRRSLRRTRSAATSAGSAAGHALSDAGESVGEFASHARQSFER